MKIIDILNKKANGILEDGFKFKFIERIFTYSKDDDLIQDGYGWGIGQVCRLEQLLNDEVEVIEENKEIEELKFEEGTYTGIKVKAQTIKINELVRAVNKLTKETEVKQ